jgi:hypothetical protein
MAFTPETGVGLAGANAYADRAFADAYFAERGGQEATQWAAVSDANKEAALVRASDYIDKRFWRKFRGYKGSTDQGLEWPRVDALSDAGWLLSGVPVEVQRAACEYALRAYKYGALAPDPGTPISRTSMPGGAVAATNPGFVTQKTERVGDLEESVSYQPPSSAGSAGLSSTVSPGVIPEYPEADLLIERVLRRANRDLARG